MFSPPYHYSLSHPSLFYMTSLFPPLSLSLPIMHLLSFSLSVSFLSLFLSLPPSLISASLCLLSMIILRMSSLLYSALWCGRCGSLQWRRGLRSCRFLQLYHAARRSSPLLYLISLLYFERFFYEIKYFVKFLLSKNWIF